MTNPTAPITSRSEAARLAVKAFPIPEDSLRELARIGREAAISFSAAGGLFGFAVNLHKDLSIASGLSPEVVATWGTIRYACFFVALILTAVGLYFFAVGHTKIEELKSKTVFSDGPYQTSRLWPRLASIAGIFALIVASFVFGRLL